MYISFQISIALATKTVVTCNMQYSPYQTLLWLPKCTIPFSEDGGEFQAGLNHTKKNISRSIYLLKKRLWFPMYDILYSPHCYMASNVHSSPQQWQWWFSRWIKIYEKLHLLWKSHDLAEKECGGFRSALSLTAKAVVFPYTLFSITKTGVVFNLNHY